MKNKYPLIIVSVLLLLAVASIILYINSPELQLELRRGFNSHIVAHESTPDDVYDIFITEDDGNLYVEFYCRTENSWALTGISTEYGEWAYGYCPWFEIKNGTIYNNCYTVVARFAPEDAKEISTSDSSVSMHSRIVDFGEKKIQYLIALKKSGILRHEDLIDMAVSQ